MPLQIRRGTNAERGALPSPLAEGEIVFVTDYQEEGVSPLWIGDGDTVGGLEINTGGGAGVVDGNNYRINIIGADSSLIVDSSSGNLFGDVTGNLTGNVTGDVLGDVTGNLTGDVLGDVTGDVLGDVTGDVLGDVTGNLTGDVLGDVTGDVTGNVISDTISVFEAITSPTTIVNVGNALSPASINITSISPIVAAFNGIVATDNPLYIDVNASRGTLTVKAPPLAGDELGGYRVQSWNGTEYITNAVLQAEIIATADMTSDLPASALVVAVSNNISFTVFRFTPSGNFIAPGGVRVGLFTSTPDTRPSGPSVFNGLMIYNTTTNKFQGYANGAWVDFH
jgi:outer membrane lipoprotein SlyB